MKEKKEKKYEQIEVELPDKLFMDLNKDEQETETFDNTVDLFESWEEPDLRRLAEDAYNDWLDSPVGYRHHTVSRKDCVDFWIAAFLAGNRSASKESNTEMLANA